MTGTYDVNKDRWPNNVREFWSPRAGFAVTPSDTLDCTDAGGDGSQFYYKRLWCTKALTHLTVIFAGDKTAANAVDLGPVPAGTMLVMQVRRIKATGTDGSPGIIGLSD